MCTTLRQEVRSGGPGGIGVARAVVVVAGAVVVAALVVMVAALLVVRCARVAAGVDCGRFSVVSERPWDAGVVGDEALAATDVVELCDPDGPARATAIPASTTKTSAAASIARVLRPRPRPIRRVNRCDPLPTG